MLAKLVLNLASCLCSIGIDPAKDEASLEEIYDLVYGEIVEEVDAAHYGNHAKYAL